MIFTATPAQCSSRGGGRRPEGRAGRRHAGHGGTPHGRLGQGQ